MVRIQVKHGGESQKEFLYDCQSTSTIDEIASEVTEIANLQSETERLVFQLQPRLSLFLHNNPKVVPLMRALSEAKSYASKDQVQHNRPLSNNVLRDQVRSVEREFMLNYHIMGFPHSNMREELLQDLVLLQEDTTQLWWAGKELMRGKRICDYIGKNEKTKEMDLSNKSSPEILRMVDLK